MIKIIAVGKIKKHYLNEGIEYYLKQLNKKIEIIEIKDEPSIEGIDIESAKILDKIESSDFVVGLVIEGNIISSESLSMIVEKVAFDQGKTLVFVIGGSYGFNTHVMARLNEKISISKMTFPHQIVRLLLVEQIYRSMMIIKNHPYHK